MILKIIINTKGLMKMKKMILIVCALVTALAMSTSAMAAFSDMPGGTDGEVLQKAVDNGLITGFEDGTIQPATPITRAQMAAIMSRAMNAQKKADLAAFGDVNEGDWYFDAMSKAVAMGAFKGDTNNNLNPNNTITRQEALIVLSRIFDMPPAKTNALEGFADWESISSWAMKEVRRVVEAGYLTGITNIRPLDAMTRLEFAQIMDKIVGAYIDKSGEYASLPHENVLIRANGVILKDIKGAKNVYYGDGVEGDVTITDCEIGNLVVRGGKATVSGGELERVRAVGSSVIAAAAVELEIDN